MNRLVLALVVVVLAGAVVAGVRREARAQDGSLEERVASLEARVDRSDRVLSNHAVLIVDLENATTAVEEAVARAGSGGLPPEQPDLLNLLYAVDPLSRLSLLRPGAEGTFRVVCRPTAIDDYLWDMTCARVPATP